MERDLNNNLKCFSEKVSQDLKNLIEKEIEDQNIQESLILSSSGSTSKSTTLYVIRHEMMLAHAKEINHIFNSHQRSKWLIALPLYYMGGLSIYYRCLERNIPYEQLLKWDPFLFNEICLEKEITHSSLVPSQLHDLLIKRIQLPRTLKYLFIGGDALSDELKRIARELHYPVYQTYGASEFCSQLATSPIDQEGIKLLPFVKAKTIDQDLYISSPYHFDKKILIDENKNVKTLNYHELLQDGYYPMSDQVHLKKRTLSQIKRTDHLIKIDGKLTSPSDVEFELLKDGPTHLNNSIAIVISKDSKRGHCLICCHCINLEDQFLTKLKNKKIATQSVEKILMTSTGKKLRNIDFYHSS
ncbi:MAG: AMP-binding protein [Bacteriovoracaceae bacterium]